MPEPLRFHLDESLTPKIAHAARLRGLDITDSHTEEMLSHSDLQQWEYCQQQGKILITADSDFLRLCKENPNHYGVVFCLGTGIGSIVRELEVLSNDILPQEMLGRIDYIR
jgi:predicted nuclease of predicted toxin-antitoxin system